MAKAKIVTWSRPNKDGHYPIGIKIWSNGKPSYIFDGHTVPSRDCWDVKRQEVKKKVPNAERLTHLLKRQLFKVEDKVLELENEKKNFSAGGIKRAVRAQKKITKKLTTFLEVANQYLEEQRDAGNVDVYKSDLSRLKRFCEFSGGGNISFDEISSEFLRRFVIFLKKEKKRNGNSKTPPKPLSERTIMNHLVIIRTLWNRAIAAKIADPSEYPFGAGNKMSIKFPESTKIGLSFEELNQLEQVDLSQTPSLNHARNVCLVGFYFAGMRITDILLMKWSDFQNGRFYYRMSKNGEPGSLKIPAKAAAIICQYKNDEPANDLIFPDLKRLENLDDYAKLRHAVNLAENRINKSMKKVMVIIGCTKNASPHKFRHAFAQRAEEKNIHPKVLQKMYRHESILTTMKYQSNFSHQKSDEALDAVLGL
jgi:integrase